MLEAERGAAAVPAEQGQRGGETGAGAVSPQGDAAVGPDAQGAGVGRQCAQSRVAVLQRRGKGVFGCEAVVDGGDENLQLPAEQQVPFVVDVR